MIKISSRIGIILLGLALVLVALAQLLPNSELAANFLRVTALLMPLVLLCQVPIGLRYFWRGPQIPDRPRQRSRSLLVAPGMAIRFGPPLVALMLLCVFLDTASQEMQVGTGFFVLCLPLFLAVLAQRLVAPGPALERRMLAQQLAAALQAGVPLADALEALAADARLDFATRFQAYPVVLSWLVFDLRSGSMLSSSLANHAYFPPLWPAMVRIGERGGQLTQCLRMLARVEAGLPRRLYLLRPLLALPFILFFWWLTRISIVPLVDGLAQELAATAASSPWPARFNLLLLIGFGLAVISLSTPLFPTGGPGRRLSSRLQKLPWVWPLSRLEQQLLAITALETSARLELPLPEMLELAAQACSHPHYQEALDPARAAAGDSLAALLAARFSPEVVALVAYGERSGDFVECLESSRLWLERKLAEQQGLSELRLMVLLQSLMGLLVLFCALEVLAPLLNVFLELTPEGPL